MSIFIKKLSTKNLKKTVQNSYKDSSSDIDVMCDGMERNEIKLNNK